MYKIATMCNHRITQSVVAVVVIAMTLIVGSSHKTHAVSVDAMAAQAVVERLRSAYCFEPTASTPGEDKVIIPGQSYKQVDCTRVFGTGPNFAAGYQFIKENGCYFIAYGVSACDEFPAVGLYLFQYLQQKYPNIPNVGQGSNGQGYETPVSSEPSTPEPAPTEESAEQEEDKSLTEQEIQAQSEALRQQLSQGTNDCGDSKTVFDFECQGSGNSIELVIYAIVRFVTYGIGIIITLSVVISGIQYATAQGDTGTVHKARMRIFNSVIALLLYIFAFAILNYLVPGGLIT